MHREIKKDTVKYKTAGKIQEKARIIKNEKQILYKCRAAVLKNYIVNLIFHRNIDNI